jgi:transposase
MRFEYTYIYGAICPERNVGEAIIISHIGKQAMQKHLNAISVRIPEDRHAIIIMDRAPWHKSLAIPSNMTIMYLPSYSPELNPQENIWEYLKNNFLSNRIFEKLSEVVDACCNAWNQLCSEPNRIRSIGSRDWAKITNVF